MSLMKSKKRKTYTSLRALQEDQKKIKKSYEDMENNMFSNLFDPTSIGLDLVSTLLNPQSQGSFKLSSVFSLFKPKAKKATSSATKQAALSAVAVSPKKKNSLARKVAVSFIKWQLFNLACWGVEKAYEQYKVSRKQKKTLKTLQKTAKTLEKALE